MPFVSCSGGSVSPAPAGRLPYNAVDSPLQFPCLPAPLNGRQYSRIKDPIQCNHGEELRMSRVFGLVQFLCIPDDSTDFVRTWNKRKDERNSLVHGPERLKKRMRHFEAICLP